MIASTRAFLLLVALVTAAASEDDHDHNDHDHHGHDHGAAPYEWAGIFKTPKEAYSWTAQKVDGKYADATMKLVALPATSSSHEALEALIPEGKHAMEETCIEVDNGDVIIPKVDTCYELHFKTEWWQSLFTVDATGVAAIAFFAEHVPAEFESTAHYLKDEAGNDIEPDAEEPHAEEAAESDDTPWGAAIGGAILVNLATLTGVVLMIPAVKRFQASHPHQFMGIVSGFVAGALIACAFFLLLFEATHLVATGWDTEVDVLWRWGIMTLSGFMLPTVIDLLAVAVGAQTSSARTVDVSEVDEKPNGQKEEDPNLHGRARVIGAVLVGDFFHNLCDGAFIGAGFKGCGNSFGWTVVLASILHELPQEIADFALLTGDVAKLSTPLALILNFASGMSVLIGAIAILASDVSDSVVGLFLAFGAGTYLHIAAVECMPKVLNANLQFRDRLASVGAFFLGAIVIGLILLDHEHCVPADSEGGAHHGHGH
eukprot:TRINITY_DN19429_c1_g1_i1.p1 TRINITY_DN19429_c1_g1~~TRINITY_DN19429_c1_g1_i1.p1  ORF type:complete len:500 (+),score=72.13 TRINITY_DN19429_c1_g1_i1:43-1500(+)